METKIIELKLQFIEINGKSYFGSLPHVIKVDSGEPVDQIFSRYLKARNLGELSIVYASGSTIITQLTDLQHARFTYLSGLLEASKKVAMARMENVVFSEVVAQQGKY